MVSEDFSAALKYVEIVQLKKTLASRFISVSVKLGRFCGLRSILARSSQFCLRSASAIAHISPFSILTTVRA